MARSHRPRSGRNRQRQRAEAEQRVQGDKNASPEKPPEPVGRDRAECAGAGAEVPEAGAGLWGSPERAREWAAKERELEALVSRVQGNALLDVSNDGRKPARLSPLRVPSSPAPPSFQGADGQIDGRALMFGRLNPLKNKSVLRVVPTDSASGATGP